MTLSPSSTPSSSYSAEVGPISLPSGTAIEALLHVLVGLHRATEVAVGVVGEGLRVLHLGLPRLNGLLRLGVVYRQGAPDVARSRELAPELHDVLLRLSSDVVDNRHLSAKGVARVRVRHTRWLEDV